MITFYSTAHNMLFVAWWAVVYGGMLISDAKDRCEDYLIGTYEWELYTDDMPFDAYSTMDRGGRETFDSRDKNLSWYCLVYRRK